MKTKLFLLCVILVISSLALAQETQDKQYVVNAVSVYGQVPVIDGVAGSGEWSDAASPGCTGFVQHGNPTVAAVEDPEVKVIFDHQYLYLLFQVTNVNFSLDFDPSTTTNDPEQDGRDPSGTGFAGDDFEFFFFPNGPDSASDQTFYHTVFFPYETNGICYVWDEAGTSRGYPGAASWDATDEEVAFSYESGSSLLTIEYKIAWTDFNVEGGVMETYPADGTEWGIQIGYINNNPSEAVNWEPDGTGGFLNGEPYGKWTFTGTPDMPEALEADMVWSLYE